MVYVIDAVGEPVERLVVAHTKAGIGRVVTLLRRYGVAGVGIERHDGPVVAALPAAGLDVFVVPPSPVRSRYGSAGHKDEWLRERRLRLATPWAGRAARMSRPWECRAWKRYGPGSITRRLCDP
ncbi:hypothetical protein AB0M46_26235 [Dactylosporangium sp. NPDC051485]|uniref:hypothetical protein n=1 Tax=Dactylosporangium sp. NPDC051485 TaxID=3154846 RepID=UPI003423685C